LPTSSAAVLDPTHSSAATRDLLGAWLALQHLLALEPQRAAERVRSQPNPRALLASLKPGSPFDRAAATAALARAGAVALPVVSQSYPERLANLSDPPLLLLVRGDVSALAKRAVAIVGARAATVYGKKVARTLAAELAREGIVIVSGLARGIDAEAHAGALEVGGQTVAVQACGIDRVYPAEHRSLAARISESGAVIGELPLGTSPRKSFFPLRNRLISGLALAVVVVEARERSGSLITAAHAANQGREVFAVPGPITAPTSLGANRLLRDGAHPCLGAEEVLDELQLLPTWTPPALPDLGVKAPSREILASLAAEPASRDELSRRLQREPEQLALELLELELDGVIDEDRDGRFRVLASRG
jgi:DNA processing protein